MPFFSPASAQTIISGYVSATATQSATTVVTIPAGRTFVGSIAITCAVTVAAASATAGSVVTSCAAAGTNVSPPAANIAGCMCFAAANVVGGLSGTQDSNSVTIPVIVTAPSGNSVTITYLTTISGTLGRTIVSINGILQ